MERKSSGEGSGESGEGSGESGEGGSWRVTRWFERFFYSWGCTVASHPWKVIAATLIVTGLGGGDSVRFFAPEKTGSSNRCRETGNPEAHWLRKIILEQDAIGDILARANSSCTLADNAVLFSGHGW